ncbi:hypothetical protein IAU60_004451 [Kwoniella sp. DSM 27419]
MDDRTLRPPNDGLDGHFAATESHIHTHRRLNPHDNMARHKPERRSEHRTTSIAKRIVMNPPASFVQYAASLQPAIPVMAGPLAISQGGQAVMLPPGNVPASNSPQPQAQAQGQTQAQDQAQATTDGTGTRPDSGSGSGDEGVNLANGTGGEVVLSGSSLVLMPTATAPDPSAATTASISTITSLSAVTSTPTAQPTTILSDTITAQSTGAPTADASSSNAPTASFTSQVDSTITSATSATSASATALSSGRSTSVVSSSITATASTSSSATAGSHKPPSAGIIFLIILLALAVFIAIGSALRYMLNSRSLPCCGGGRDDDDDPDLRFDDDGYKVYDPYSDGTEYKEDAGLSRRASLFARGGRSPFLHSGTATSPTLPFGGHTSVFADGDAPGPNPYLDPEPIALPAPVFQRNNPFGGSREESIAPLPSHLYGETGPLEVRNALPGEIHRQASVAGREGPDEHDEADRPRSNGYSQRESSGVDGLVGLGPDSSSPRFLGLDGNGLAVPWSLPHRPSSIDSFDAAHPNPFGSTSTMSNSNSLSIPTAPPMFTSPTPSDDLLPMRSATWASNLRNTLYNAISAARAPTNPLEVEDRFTRTVGAVVRASSRRKGLPSFDPEKGLEIVREAHDDDSAKIAVKLPLPPQAALTLLSRVESSSSGSSTLIRPRKNGAGERYKRYYARPKSTSVSAPMSEEASEMSEGDAESIRPPTALAGGARAKGVRTGSFVFA